MVGIAHHFLIEGIQDISFPRARLRLPQNIKYTDFFAHAIAIFSIFFIPTQDNLCLSTSTH
jgi:hypothetical protein